MAIYSGFTMIYPVKMVIFHRFPHVYHKVSTFQRWVAASAPLRAAPAGDGLPPRPGRAAGPELRGLSAPASGRPGHRPSWDLTEPWESWGFVFWGKTGVTKI